MSTPVGIKDVARHAGVSIGTVSHVLNRPELVAPATLERVRRAIDSLGFVRNESARQLRAGKSRMIGLVLLDVGNPFFTDLARGAELVAEHAGMSLMLCSSNEQPDKEARHVALFEEQRVQGVLISPVDVDAAHLSAVRKRGTPVVLLDGVASSPDQCSVAVDDVLGGRLAAEHLVAQGHRRIAFVGGPVSLRQVKDRLKGVREIISRHPRVTLTVVETMALTVAAGRDAAASLLSKAHSRRPTAVFCANDLLALGLLQELTRHHVAVPEDMAIVGYDDIDFAAAAAVPLSSVRQPREELGRAAAELLIEEVVGQAHTHRRLVFKPELVVRESSSRPVGGRASPPAPVE